MNILVTLSVLHSVDLFSSAADFKSKLWTSPAPHQVMYSSSVTMVISPGKKWSTFLRHSSLSRSPPGEGGRAAEPLAARFLFLSVLCRSFWGRWRSALTPSLAACTSDGWRKCSLWCVVHVFCPPILHPSLLPMSFWTVKLHSEHFLPDFSASLPDEAARWCRKIISLSH